MPFWVVPAYCSLWLLHTNTGVVPVHCNPGYETVILAEAGIRQLWWTVSCVSSYNHWYPVLLARDRFRYHIHLPQKTSLVWGNSNPCKCWVRKSISVSANVSTCYEVTELATAPPSNYESGPCVVCLAAQYSLLYLHCKKKAHSRLCRQII